MQANERVAFSVTPSLRYDETSEGTIRDEIRTLLGKLSGDQSKPLRDIVRPGDTVLLKPNLVLDRVPDPVCALTNGAVIKAVCDLVLEALEGQGRVIIADVPLQSATFERVVALSGLDAVMKEYARQGAPVELRDLRKEYLLIVDDMHRGVHPLPGDPKGYTVVNLGPKSELEPLSAFRGRFAVGDYDKESTASYHMSSSRNEYLIPNSVLQSDVLINLPKLKTHKKTGITCALKNLVGICGHKSYLPHYREGRPVTGGDEFAVDHPIKEFQRNTIDFLKSSNSTVYRVVRAIGRVILRLAMRREAADLRTVMAGSWYGNDTLWRTILDLNKIAKYADRDGRLHDTPQRRYLCIVDGIIAGEGDGPLKATARPAGVLVAGKNPVTVDLFACWLMGFDPEGIRQVRRAFDVHTLGLVETPYEKLLADPEAMIAGAREPIPNMRFAMPPGWEGYIPRRGAPSRAGSAA